VNGSRAYRWLAVVPALAILAGVPAVNGVHAYVAGMPFLLAWIVGCVLLTSAVLAVISALDRRSDASHAPGPADEASRESAPGARRDPK
jgi:hypothetical protein